MQIGMINSKFSESKTLKPSSLTVILLLVEHSLPGASPALAPSPLTHVLFRVITGDAGVGAGLQPSHRVRRLPRCQGPLLRLVLT